MVGRRTVAIIMHYRIAACVSIEGARVLAVVAVQAQEFPIAAVGRIVVVVAVLVVHRQLVQFLAGKFPPAPGAYPRQDLERFIAIKIPSPRPHLPRFSENVLQFTAIRSGRL